MKMSELRERISQTIWQRWVTDMGMSMPTGMADKLADAVIEELGIFRQYLVDEIISDGEPREWEVPCEARWTTEWERFDGTA
jgi:hypothetical protein